MLQLRLSLFLVALSVALISTGAFTPAISLKTTHTKVLVGVFEPRRSLHLGASECSADLSQPAPVLDGQRVLPFKIMKAGLNGHKVAAVYALLNSDFKRGGEGWDVVEYVGVSMDLDASLKEHSETLGASKTAHVKALSFAIPSKAGMDDWAKKWRTLAEEAGGNTIRAEDYMFDEDDEDEDDEDWDPEMLASVSATVAANDDEIVSPFDPNLKAADSAAATSDEELVLSMENVDKVLDEVRPYLIADGGNVAVEDVDAEKGAVYLKLEGACGSCASSTITMSMGIERVLKENFSTFKKVIQVEDPENAGPTSLTMEAVEEEFSRIYPAIIAMGGVSKIVGINSDLGVVSMEFRGSNKVRQGLELAIFDLPFVNHVEFTMDE